MWLVIKPLDLDLECIEDLGHVAVLMNTRVLISSSACQSSQGPLDALLSTFPFPNTSNQGKYTVIFKRLGSVAS